MSTLFHHRVHTHDNQITIIYNYVTFVVLCFLYPLQTETYGNIRNISSSVIKEMKLNRDNVSWRLFSSTSRIYLLAFTYITGSSQFSYSIAEILPVYSSYFDRNKTNKLSESPNWSILCLPFAATTCFLDRIRLLSRLASATGISSIRIGQRFHRPNLVMIIQYLERIGRTEQPVELQHLLSFPWYEKHKHKASTVDIL